MEQELKELRQMVSDFDSGIVSAKKINTKIGIYSQIEKRMALMVKVTALSQDAKTKKMFVASNFIGEHEAIDVGVTADVEMINCPDLEKAIARNECYDRAGSTEHSAGCDSCHHKKVTYAKLS